MYVYSMASLYVTHVFMLCCTRLRAHESESLSEIITYKQMEPNIPLSCLRYMVEMLSAFRRESIFSSSHYAQHKITSSKPMENVYKANNAACLMCDHVQRTMY